MTSIMTIIVMITTVIVIALIMMNDLSLLCCEFVNMVGEQVDPGNVRWVAEKQSDLTIL